MTSGLLGCGHWLACSPLGGDYQKQMVLTRLAAELKRFRALGVLGCSAHVCKYLLWLHTLSSPSDSCCIAPPAPEPSIVPTHAAFQYSATPPGDSSPCHATQAANVHVILVVHRMSTRIPPSYEKMMAFVRETFPLTPIIIVLTSYNTYSVPPAHLVALPLSTLSPRSVDP